MQIRRASLRSAAVFSQDEGFSGPFPTEKGFVDLNIADAGMQNNPVHSN
jgi:hypothetical protein